MFCVSRVQDITIKNRESTLWRCCRMTSENDSAYTSLHQSRNQPLDTIKSLTCHKLESRKLPHLLPDERMQIHKQ